MRVFQLFFGVIAGLPLAAGELFMLSNIELLYSEGFHEITTAEYVRHYVVSSSPVIGYVCLVFAYFRKSEYPPVLTYMVSTGLMIGILFTCWTMFLLLKPVYGFIFLNYAATNGLRFDIFFSLIGIGLADCRRSPGFLLTAASGASSHATDAVQSFRLFHRLPLQAATRSSSSFSRCANNERSARP